MMPLPKLNTLVITVTLSITFSACATEPVKVKTGLEGKTLPAFSMLLQDSITKFNTNKIKNGSPFVLLYFGPECPYSRAQVEEIIANMNSLKSINFYLLTIAPLREIKNFTEYYGLNKYHNVSVMLDNTLYFGNYFKTQITPYIAVYDKKKQLKQVFIGRTDVTAIKDLALNQ